jgi:hypothetical protein
LPRSPAAWLLAWPPLHLAGCASIRSGRGLSPAYAHANLVCAAARPPHTDDRPTHPPPLRARPRPPACVCVRLASLAPTHPHRVVSHVSLPPSVGSVGFLSLSLHL